MDKEMKVHFFICVTKENHNVRWCYYTTVFDLEFLDQPCGNQFGFA